MNPGKLMLALDIIVAGILIAKIMLRMKKEQSVVVGED